MNRQLQPELLDELPPADPRAIHSRRDLRRINAIMGNARYLEKFLVGIDGRRFISKKITLLEIGAGDGNISLHLARALACQGISGALLLLDRQRVCDPSIQIPGWSSEVIEADIFDWIKTAPQIDITIANLFLHHFTDGQLRSLFSSLSQITNVFAACEPRRNKLASFVARNVWMIGCNPVTCHDAEISVRAGFREKELSALWPSDDRWNLTERRAGLFTHFFAAVRDR
jgi:hypothetical protein